MRWYSAILAAAATKLVASEDGARCPAPRVWPSQLDDVAFDDTRPRLGCVADQCEPCLGKEWDPLREVKGLLGIKRDREPVVIEFGNWLSSQVQAAVSRILVEEMLGYEVRYLPRSDDDMVFPRLASGATTLNPEIWSYESHKLEDYTTYVLEKECAHVQFCGVTAVEALYAPAYSADEVCSTLSIDTLGDIASRDTPVTEGMRMLCESETWPESECTDGRWVPPQCEGPRAAYCSEVLLGAPTWAKAWFEANIVNLGLNFTTLYLPNLAEEIQRRYANREDFIFYWYEPDPLLSTIDAKRIDLPPWSETCAKKYCDDPLLSGVDCEIKPDTLLRGLHAATRRTEPDLAHFDESFVWAPGELDRIMVATLPDRGNLTVRDAACAWLKEKKDRWMQVIQHTPDDEPSDGKKRRRDRGFTRQTWFIALLIGIACLAMVIALYMCCYSAWAAWREANAARTEMDEARLLRLQRAVDAVHTVEHPMVVFSLESLRRFGRLPPHEAVRSELVFLDNYDDVVEFASSHPILFVSHQWLGRDEPDPDGTHFAAICRAAQAIQRKCGVDDLYLWCDYASVPQRNCTSQAAACNTLAVYSNAARYFVAVCPSGVHRDTGERVDASTYLARGWCRLEMWAMMNKAGGAAAMYVYDDAGLAPIAGRRDWYNAAMRVFEGDFSREDDKEKLVDNVLGLYARALRQADATSPRTRRRFSAPPPPPPPDPRSPMDDSSHTVRSSATPTTVRFSEATVPPSPELSVRSTSRSSPRPTLEKMLTSRSFHTLQSSALDKLRRRKRGECKGDTSGKSDWCRETVFPELYFGGLVEALEEHMANGDVVFPEGK